MKYFMLCVLFLSPFVTFANAREFDALQYDLVEVEGVYYSGFEVSNFQPCHSDERWWLSVSDSNLWDEVQPNRKDDDELLIAERFVRISAYVTRSDGKNRARPEMFGGYGHLGAYNREVIVVDVLEASELTKERLARCVDEEDRERPSKGIPGL